jgi:glycerol uptake facilitator-like aquaporin
MESYIYLPWFTTCRYGIEFIVGSVALALLVVVMKSFVFRDTTPSTFNGLYGITSLFIHVASSIRQGKLLEMVVQSILLLTIRPPRLSASTLHPCKSMKR